MPWLRECGIDPSLEKRHLPSHWHTPIMERVPKHIPYLCLFSRGSGLLLFDLILRKGRTRNFSSLDLGGEGQVLFL